MSHPARHAYTARTQAGRATTASFQVEAGSSPAPARHLMCRACVLGPSYFAAKAIDLGARAHMCEHVQQQGARRARTHWRGAASVVYNCTLLRGLRCRRVPQGLIRCLPVIFHPCGVCCLCARCGALRFAMCALCLGVRDREAWHAFCCLFPPRDSAGMRQTDSDSVSLVHAQHAAFLQNFLPCARARDVYTYGVCACRR